MLDGKFGVFAPTPAPTRSPLGWLGDDQPGKRGIALGKSEIGLSANVDQALYGNVTLSFSSENTVSVEEAFLQTTALPYGLKVKAGLSATSTTTCPYLGLRQHRRCPIGRCSTRNTTMTACRSNGWRRRPPSSRSAARSSAATPFRRRYMPGSAPIPRSPGARRRHQRQLVPHRLCVAPYRGAQSRQRTIHFTGRDNLFMLEQASINGRRTQCSRKKPRAQARIAARPATSTG